MIRKNPLDSYFDSFTDTLPTIASVMDEESSLMAVTRFSGLHITDISECMTGNIPNVFLYQKEEEKKSLSIEVIRKFLIDVVSKPYSGKALYLITDIHTASIEALNSMLKILEEPPEHAIIILVTDEPNSLLDTIRSRTLQLFHSKKTIPLSSEIQKMIQDFFEGNILPFTQFLFEAKYDTTGAMSILAYTLSFADSTMLKHIQQGISDLIHVNENPRNILDRIFIAQK